MRTRKDVAYGLTVTTLLGLTLMGWTRSTPAKAQDPAQPPPGGGRFGRMMGGGAPAIAASGDSVYVLRGNTVYKMKASDLSIVAHGDLPAPPPPGGGGNAAGNP